MDGKKGGESITMDKHKASTLSSFELLAAIRWEAEELAEIASMADYDGSENWEKLNSRLYQIRIASKELLGRLCYGRERKQ